MGFTEPKFPQSLYNSKGEFRTVNNELDKTKAKQDGFNQKYVKTHFPKWLYNPKGDSVLVNDESELQARGAEGYGEDFVAAPAKPVKNGFLADHSEKSDAITRALMAENRDLHARIEALEELAQLHVDKFAELDAKLAEPALA